LELPTVSEQYLTVLQLKGAITTLILRAKNVVLDSGEIVELLSNLEELIVEAIYYGNIVERNRKVD